MLKQLKQYKTHVKFGPWLLSVAPADREMRTDPETYSHLLLLKFNCSITASAWLSDVP